MALNDIVSLNISKIITFPWPTDSPSKFLIFQKWHHKCIFFFFCYSAGTLVFTCIKILCSDVCKGKDRKHAFTSQTAENSLWIEKCNMAPQVKKLIFFYTINSYLYLSKAFLREKDWKWCQCQRLIRFFEKSNNDTTSTEQFFLKQANL